MRGVVRAFDAAAGRRRRFQGVGMIPAVQKFNLAVQRDRPRSNPAEILAATDPRSDQDRRGIGAPRVSIATPVCIQADEVARLPGVLRAAAMGARSAGRFSSQAAIRSS